MERVRQKTNSLIVGRETQEEVLIASVDLSGLDCIIREGGILETEMQPCFREDPTVIFHVKWSW